MGPKFHSVSGQIFVNKSRRYTVASVPGMTDSVPMRSLSLETMFGTRHNIRISQIKSQIKIIGILENKNGLFMQMEKKSNQFKAHDMMIYFPCMNCMHSIALQEINFALQFHFYICCTKVLYSTMYREYASCAQTSFYVFFL